MKRALAAIAAACLLAACGNTPAAHNTRCSTADYAMSCALQTQHAPRTVTLAPVTAHGIDFAWSCPPPSGVQFGASYISTDRTKNWTVACVNRYHAARARTVVVWETLSTRALGGFTAGTSDARAAAAQAKALGEPSTRPIYFAVDFDETPAQAAAVASYFQGVASVLGINRTGGYGGYWVISRLFNARLISYGWQTYAWSGGRWDPRAQLEQYLNGATADQDRAISADYGQWPYTPPKPKPPKRNPSYNENFQGGFLRGFTVAWDRRRHHTIPAPTFAATNRGAYNTGFQDGFGAGWKAAR